MEHPLPSDKCCPSSGPHTPIFKDSFPHMKSLGGVSTAGLSFRPSWPSPICPSPAVSAVSKACLATQSGVLSRISE